MNWISLGAVGSVSVRDSADILSFRNRLWLAGGYYYGGINYRDFYRGTGPSSFAQQISNPSAPFDEYAKLIGLGGSLYAIRNSVWKVTGDPSSGAHWTKICDPTPWSAGLSHIQVVTLSGQIIFAITNNGIWSSTDGASWTNVHDGAGFPATGFAAAVLGRSIYVFAGATGITNVPPEAVYAGFTSFTAMLVSNDGANWSDIGPVPFAPRMWPGIALLNNSILMFGGFNNVASSNHDDTWTFAADIGWTKIATPTKPPSRHAPAAFTYNGSFHILGGNRNPDVLGPGSFLNDLWVLES